MKSIVLCNYHVPEKSLPYYDEFGFGVEIQKFLDIVDDTDDIIALYNKVLPVGIERYMHAPYWDLCLGSSNKRISDVTRLFFDYSYDVAGRLGCQGVTVHHGDVPHTTRPAKWVERAVGFWQDFFDSNRGDVKVFMENHLERTPDMLIEIIDKCEEQRLAVNLDVGHAHAFSELSVVEWIVRLGSRIGYVHLHQNNGSYDEHLALTKGNMEMQEILHALEEHAPQAVWALEHGWDDLDESIAFLIECGFVKRGGGGK